MVTDDLGRHDGQNHILLHDQVSRLLCPPSPPGATHPALSRCRGKRTATISMTEDVTDMCAIALKKSKVSHALLVGLANGEVCLSA